MALLSEKIGRTDKHIDRQYELLGNCPPNWIAALGPVVQGFEDDQQIYVAVRAGVAAGMAAEEDDLFRIEALGNQLGYSLDRGFVDNDLRSLAPSPFAAFFPGCLEGNLLQDQSNCNGFRRQSEFAP